MQKFEPYSLKKEVSNEEFAFCNLYKSCKMMNALEIADGKKRKLIDMMEQELDGTTLVTYGGDWGIKHRECRITKNPLYPYSIENATVGGPYLDLEIKSVSNVVNRWYMTNMSEEVAVSNVYPVPLNAQTETFDGLDVDEIRGHSRHQNGKCYANFTITHPYRIRVAEWAWTQDYIDCNFPKRYDNQDVELDMPILCGEMLNRQEFLFKLASYGFALAPIGNGVDTFRTWECIVCNTVPIVQDKWLNRVFSKIWPMILVHRYEWANLPKLMEDFYEEHGEMNYDYSLLQKENFGELLNRIQYESDRLRR